MTFHPDKPAPVAPPSSPQSEGKSEKFLNDAERGMYTASETRDHVEVDREVWERLISLARIGATAKPTDGWRPIESAPKDGTRLWLFYPQCPLDDRQLMGWWELDVLNEPCWMDYADSSQGEPTHWMPLPNAPVQS